ncbi:MAG: PCYCGC domain-containing protein [Vicinamibacterales bacterium]|nr:PCYCGC domain-containing protein [Vicinamibacterales bacterium]
MTKTFLPTIALCGVIALSACSRNSEAPAGAANTAAAEKAATDTAATAAKVENQPTIDHPLTKTIVVPPKVASGAPHGPGFDMPLIELGGYAPPRPMEVLRDAHIFTADHPEVASFIPCYCGCGQSGHKDNADCFIRGRDPQGRVTEWEPHGAACAVCIDIAVESMRMRNSGASVTAIRQQVQNEYRPNFPSTETPTPAPPAGK